MKISFDVPKCDLKTTYSARQRQPDADLMGNFVIAVLSQRRGSLRHDNVHAHVDDNAPRSDSRSTSPWALFHSFAREGLARGERHGQSKLTSEQVSQIKTRLRAGEKLTYLAREYGVDLRFDLAQHCAIR